MPPFNHFAIEQKFNVDKFGLLKKSNKIKVMKAGQKTTREAKCGRGREYIPNPFFRMMTFAMKTMDILTNYSNRKFNTLRLEENQMVVDYGCGPARYIRNASLAVGPKGKVYAVDIHPMALEHVEKVTRKHHLQNVEAVLADGYSCPIPGQTADVVYALDMFHMIEQPTELLKELTRIVKSDGKVIIEDGHQPRENTIRKIEQAGILVVKDQNKYHVVCVPKN
ncbi:MAG TPA: class I SAM-dependent methyltransferase [Draconibacterium sp.]|nr:class I SAM-dependent methyltransferase [Draconibacterium sp.]